MAEATRLEYRLLGHLEVHSGSDDCTPRQGKQRSVLALLLLNANQPVSVDRLIELLWPKRAPGRPQTAIQGYVSALRKSLGLTAIATTAGGYILHADPEQLDSHRFERLLGEGHDAQLAGDAEHAVHILGRALDLWRGDALADFTYEAWARDTVGRLDELRLVCREELIEARLALGQHAELAGELEAIIRAHPLRERPRAQLMLALYRYGRQAEALEVYQQARSHLREELGITPGPDLQTLYKRILNQDETLNLKPSRPHPTHNLVAPPTRLIGRQDDLEQIEAMLGRDDVRLVTLTGPGGTGKTRLAHQVATNLIGRFRDGVYNVPLATISDADLVLPTAAQTLGLREAAVQPIEETLGDHLADRQVLLLLDNFEQVVGAAPALAALLARAPGLKAIVTSRTPLHLSGERLYPVPPLAVPDIRQLGAIESLVRYEAVSLFFERAQAANPDFAITKQNATAVADICVRLDGLPLAIELAAARIRALPPEALRRRLDHRLRLLTGGAQDVDERQRTLRGTMDWSYRLLSQNEQKLFSGLAVFIGGCRIEAAEIVCHPDRTLDVTDGLTSLVDNSLLRQREDADGEPRYWMLETVRDFALDQLATDGQEQAVRTRFAEHFLEFAEQIEPQLRGGAMREVRLKQLDTELDNLRAALTWFREQDSLEKTMRFMIALWRFWLARGHLREWSPLTREITTFDDVPLSLRSRALEATGVFLISESKPSEAIKVIEASLSAYQDLGDALGIRESLVNLGVATLSKGNVEGARSLYEQSAQLAREAGDGLSLALATLNLGDIALNQGDYATAIRLSEEAAALYEREQDNGWAAIALGNLGSAALESGNESAAADAFDRALAYVEAFPQRDYIGYLLDGLAAVSARHEPRRAACLLGACNSLLDSFGGSLSAGYELERHEQTLSVVLEQLGDPSFSELYTNGARMTVEQAIAYARRGAEYREPREHDGVAVAPAAFAVDERSNESV